MSDVKIAIMDAANGACSSAVLADSASGKLRPTSA